MQARDVYEEAIQTVMTVRDFSQVFEAYAEFEEQTLAALMEALDEADESGIPPTAAASRGAFGCRVALLTSSRHVACSRPRHHRS